MVCYFLATLLLSDTLAYLHIDDGYETDIVPGMREVYGDFDALRKKAGISSFKGKFVKRKYAFGESGIPTQETQWMKVIYPFTGELYPLDPLQC